MAEIGRRISYNSALQDGDKRTNKYPGFSPKTKIGGAIMSYIRIWVHLVFGTKNRETVLTTEIREKVMAHIAYNARVKGIFIDCLGGYTEHLHCLFSLGADQSIAKISNLIKGESSYWVNTNKIIRTKFEWADEYYAASISESQVDVERHYIAYQEEHHRKRSYTEECEEFLKKYRFKELG